MLTILSVLLIIVSIIVIFAVLIQNPKGGGIAANFNFPTQIVGVQRSTDIIEKITWGFAVLIFVICIGTSFMKPEQGNGFDTSVKEALENGAGPKQTTPPAGQQPAQPAPAQPAK